MYVIQSVLLKRSKYTLKEAIEWIHKNNYKSSKVDTTDDYYRFRQVSPTDLTDGKFKTIPLGDDGYIIVFYSSQGFRLEKATDGVHKWIGVFDDKTRVPFGAFGMGDYTINKDPARRRLYLLRHRSRENWNNPKTPGALSRWLLWETPSLEKNLSLFKSRFGLN